ncbi:MAG: DUF2806 domain-containing protein [Deltaproteobacteria bacterium]|nr:DUF2806 domain-containing protein [Deltaproteobacteria bacterium]
MADNDESGGSSIVGVKVEVLREVLGKAPEKLVENLRAGAWTLFEPYQMVRIAKAKVTAAKIRAEGQREIQLLHAKRDDEERKRKGGNLALPAPSDNPKALVAPDDEPEPIPLVQRAARHLELQAAQRQANVEAVVAEAAEQIRDIPDAEVTDKPADPVFATRLLGYAQDATDDDVRTMWAKVLADEVRHGDGAVRALDALRSLSKSEAKKFERLARCAANNGFVPLVGRDSVDGLKFDDIIQISEAGLVVQDFNLSIALSPDQEGPGGEWFCVPAVYKDLALRVVAPRGFKDHLDGVKLTVAGRVIARSLRLETDLDWLKTVCDAVSRKSRVKRVSLHRVRTRDGRQLGVYAEAVYEGNPEKRK